MTTMNLPSLAVFQGQRVVLASTSPRRKQVLSLLASLLNYHSVHALMTLSIGITF